MRSPGATIEASSSLRFSRSAVHQVVAVEVEQVEGVVDDGNVVAGAPDAAAACADSGALLHQAERGPALLVERDDLAVEDGRARLDVVSAMDVQFGICGGQIVLVARDQAHARRHRGTRWRDSRPT